MREALLLLGRALAALLKSRQDLVLENLALRQQLQVLSRTSPRPKLGDRDRRFWILLVQIWKRWREALVVVRPDTVVGWHRRGFRHCWRRKSQPGPGRPRTDSELRALIRTMAESNPLWGAPKIHGELLKLGIKVSQATVSRYMPRRTPGTSQTWKTFLDNHVRDVVAVDFFSVPTVTFRVLHVFIVLAHDRRRILHFNVAEKPTAAGAARQIIAAFPWTQPPRFLLHDGDGIFGDLFKSTVESLAMEDLVTAAHSPWQDGHCERIIGSIRRECLDHVIVLNERHLLAILTRYFDYYHRCRTHLSLAKDSPETREVEPPSLGPIRAVPQVGGLHRRYTRKAA